ncbi:restriction endonuclease subunit S [Citrobacter portucalensis]|uniref:restriction endonuclease subunit S n=1 Tax=Citrobacter portucalensis TaxID=1639133 RepID=UPI001299D871|nr:restriction endonuclease subunit S [Citrobacter portucalensis]MRF60913.1 restriction endonuclease subunit S [Citrobacter portucalensis]
MAKYKAYPEYKDSGVEWLGEIPYEWKVNRVKYIAPFQVGWTPSTRNEANFIGENLWANISDLREKFISSTAKFISDQAAKEASMEITPKGSLLYSFKLSVGSISFADCDLYTNEAIASFIDEAKLPLSYLYYTLPTFIIENASTNIYGAKILNQELIKSSHLLVPNSDEADKIATFLDHETTKIDNLINKQQQLIKLLKEKRQAVISHAVTKGLNPDVPMKDSGVEWLGTIPRNWNCVAIKNICKIVNGSTPKSSIEEYWDGDIDWFTPTDLSHKETIQINDSLRKITNSGFLSCGTTMVPANTVILSSRAPIGSLAITKKSACTNQGCKSLVTFSAQLSKYIYYSLLSFNSPLNNLGRGSTFLELSTDDLGGFKISLPNDDLGEIIKYIDMTILKIDNLIEKQLQQIELLKERRTALISAAVTGKIDVRNWRVPNEQTAGEAEAAL